MDPRPQTPDPRPDFTPGQGVKFTGGRYNGLTATIRWMGDQWAQFIVIYDNKPFDIIEELRHATPLPTP